MFWYSGFDRIFAAVAASGACRFTRLSHDCLVSSIAAHSSPRGVTPASSNADSGTCFSTLPNPSRPSALASRLAGSTVRTRTLPPCFTATIAATAAAVVVFPTPLLPQNTATSLAANSCSIEPGIAAVFDGISSVPQLRPECLGHEPRRAQAVRLREQLGDVEHRQRRRDRRTKVLEVASPRPPQRHRQPGGVEDRFGAG